MDGTRQQGDARVEETLRTIKREMPETYRAIQAKAQQVGKLAYGLVRRSAAGAPNLFFAVERGFVVGTPFRPDHQVMQAALAGVALGSGFVVIWGGEAADGA